MASSDDDVDPELVELLRQKMGLVPKPKVGPHDEDTRVLEDAQFAAYHAIDVVIDPFKTKEAAELIYRMMQRKKYSTKTWDTHPLHPKAKDEATVDFIFTMDLLNFSFWSGEEEKEKQFAIEYKGQKWNGYSSLVGCLQRALDEGECSTEPEFLDTKSFESNIDVMLFQTSQSRHRLSGQTKRNAQTKNYATSSAQQPKNRSPCSMNE